MTAGTRAGDGGPQGRARDCVPAPHTFIGSSACLVVAVLLSATAGIGADAQGSSRTVYATVTSDAGQPVLDMRAEDFEVREGGRVQEIAVRPAAAPLRVALIVSDRGRGQFQLGALRFAEALLGRAELSITGIVVQPELLTDFTASTEALRGALLRVGRRSTPSDAGAQLVEAILDAARTVNRDGWRPAIVVMRSGGEALTPISSTGVHRALRQSRAVFYAVSPLNSEGRSWPDSHGESRLVLPSVLGDGPRESGGRHAEVVVNTMVPTMQQIASELINQYEITYTLPPGMSPSDRLAVRSNRRNVTVRAPSRVPGS